ncbi:MAG: recombinase family protein [Hyphomicrobiales bacterium]|nr:recombinase family protein [Hyphomicrobiales bacterium]
MTASSTDAQKAVIFCRGSDPKQEKEGHGLDSQELRCRQHAAQNGYDIVAIFPDVITGEGDFMKRPGMAALLTFLDAHPHENFVVIFDDLKRYARDVEFHLKLRREMLARGAIRECLNFDFRDSPEGKLHETIVAATGAYERESNGRQVSQKMKARLESGYWVMRNPPGYHYEEIEEHGKLLIRTEPVASIISEMLEGYASGRFETLSEAVRFLERQPDYPKTPKGTVRIEQVAHILENPIYAGILCHEPWGVKNITGKHEALISVETFHRIKDRREQKAKTSARKNIGNDFVLRGFITCGDCGAPLRSSWPKGRSKNYPYYLCQTKGCDSYGKSIARDKVEGEVGEIIKFLQPTRNLTALVKDMFRTIWDQQQEQVKDIVQFYKRKIQTTDQKIGKLLERIVESSNDLVIQAYEGKIEKLENDKLRYQREMLQIKKPRASYSECLEPALQFITSPWKLWVSGDITLRRIVLKLAFADRLAYHRFEGARTANFALPFKALQGYKNSEIQNGGRNWD